MTVANSTPISTPDVSTPSLRAQAIRASMWTFGGFAATRGLRLVSNLIMTRLLLPEAFGIMAVVSLLTTGLQMFSDVGIGPSIIQNKRGDDPAYLNTAWTIQVVRGFLLWLVACGLAWPVAQFYDTMPELLALLPVAGLSAVILGFQSTSLVTLNKHLDLSKETILQIIAKGGSLVVMIVVALITRSVWALVIGGLVNNLITTVFSHTVLRDHRNRFVWDRACARELFGFGRWIFISTALTFLAMSGDRIILAKLISGTALGVYAIAYLWYDVPRSLIMRFSAKVIFPTMSKAQDMPLQTFRERVEQNRGRLLPVIAIGLALVISFSDFMINVLYPSAYGGAGWMLALLAGGLWFRVLDQTLNPALLVFRKLQYNPLGSVLRIGFIGLLLPVAYMQWGLAGAVVVVAASDVPNYLMDQVGLVRNRLALPRQDLVMSVLLVVLVAVFLLLRVSTGLGLPIDGMGDPIVESTTLQATASVVKG